MAATSDSPRRHGPARRWTDERIERELRAAMRELGRWPSDSALRRSGRSGLARAVSSYGGAAHWAARIGVELPRGRGELVWTDARIAAALTPFLEGRTGWPSEAEFARARLAALHAACETHGGIAYWAERCGLAAPRRGRPRKG